MLTGKLKSLKDNLKERYKKEQKEKTKKDEGKVELRKDNKSK